MKLLTTVIALSFSCQLAANGFYGSSSDSTEQQNSSGQKQECDANQQSCDNQDKKAEHAAPKPNDVFERIKPYEGNTVYFDYGRGNSLDGNIDVQYSFRFVMSSLNDMQHEHAIIFSGEFDFYAKTRDSGPVIGRRYNPGYRYQYSYQGKNDGFVALTLSLEHESNGQVIDSPAALEASKIEFQHRYSEEHPNIPG